MALISIKSTRNVIEFLESLNEMGNCLLGKTDAACDADGGNVLSTFANLQLKLQKIVDTYCSYEIVAITNQADSFLSELLKLEACLYAYQMNQNRDKGEQLFWHLGFQHWVNPVRSRVTRVVESSIKSGHRFDQVPGQKSS